MNIDLNKAAKVDDVNLLNLIVFHISEIVGKEESIRFSNFPEMKRITNLNPIMQKININIKLRSILLQYANKTQGDITGLLTYILDDAENVIWLDMIDRTILRFFKEKEVLKHI